jgi:hypothetical protein
MANLRSAKFSNGRTLGEYADALMLPASVLDEQFEAWRKIRPSWSEDRIAEEMVSALETVLRDFVPKAKVKRGPILVSEPTPKKVNCRGCGATIAYLSEDVDEYNRRDISDKADGYRRVKCPRVGCRDHGYIDVW